MILKWMSQFKINVLVFISYLLISLLYNIKLLVNIASELPTSGISFMWISMFDFVHKSISYTVSPFEIPFWYYPTGYTISEYYVQLVLSIPFTAVFGPVISYNIIYLLSYSLSAYFMYLLAKHFIPNSTAPYISGLIFSFSSYHFAHSDIFPIFHIEFIPLLFYFYFKSMRNSDIKNLVLLMVSFLLVSLSSWYYATMIAISIALLTFLFYIYKYEIVNIKKLIIILLPFGLGALLLYPLSPISRISLDTLSAIGNFDYFITYSADLSNLIIPPPYHILGGYTKGIYSNYLGNSAENSVYIGYITILLSIIAITRIRIIKEVRIFLIITIIFIILSLGPFLKIFGIVYHDIKLPFFYLYELPILNFGRAVSRYFMISLTFISILAAYGLNIIQCKYKKYAKLIFIIFVVLVLFDNFYIVNPKPLPEIPTYYHNISHDDSENTVVLELPIVWSSVYPYYQMTHGKYVMGGSGDRERAEFINTILKIPFLRECVLLSDKKRNDNPLNLSNRLMNVNIKEEIIDTYHIKYIILHKKDPYLKSYNQNVESESFTKLNKFINATLQNDLIKVYEDDELIVYVPK